MRTVDSEQGIVNNNDADEPLVCEGCEEEADELFEDEGMNMLCAACYALGVEDGGSCLDQ